MSKLNKLPTVDLTMNSNTVKPTKDNIYFVAEDAVCGLRIHNALDHEIKAKIYINDVLLESLLKPHEIQYTTDYELFIHYETIIRVELYHKNVHDFTDWMQDYIKEWEKRQKKTNPWFQPIETMYGCQMPDLMRPINNPTSTAILSNNKDNRELLLEVKANYDSNQNYVDASYSFSPFMTFVFTVHPMSKKDEKLKKDTGVFCVNCGKKRKENHWIYCPDCGQKFVL